MHLCSTLLYHTIPYHPVTVTLDARGYLAWTLLGIILFLRSLHSKFCTWDPDASAARYPSQTSTIPYHHTMALSRAYW